jgi:hypothetical protein
MIKSKHTLLCDALIGYVHVIRNRHDIIENRIKRDKLPSSEERRRINQDNGLLLYLVKELLFD